MRIMKKTLLNPQYEGGIFLFCQNSQFKVKLNREVLNACFQTIFFIIMQLTVKFEQIIGCYPSPRVGAPSLTKTGSCAERKY